jgi:ribonucleotide monophosphatase NagD (HAD superfamily)
MGGECEYFGKPHAEHFKACLRELGLDADRVCHVGDSLHHDIEGANRANISSVFITGGIHSDDFDCDIGEIPERDALVELFEEMGCKPTHVSPLLQYC